VSAAVRAESVNPLDAVFRQIMVRCGQTDNELSFVLQRNDHPPPDPDVLTYVSMNLLQGEDEERIVCDFTNATAHDLDARESALRHSPTDFGVLAAECVRQKGKADIAILNAGAFRCDAHLPRRLRVRDLRDTFLYDSNDAILVITLPLRAVERALEHGNGKPGTGAYPQVSPDQLPTAANLCVAIAKYLVADERSIDGYDRVIADALNMPVAQFRQRCAIDALDKYSFEAAIVENATSVGYRSPVLTKVASEMMGQFIEISNRLWAFYPGPLNESAFWMSLRDDNPLDNARMQECRDALRALVREHFGVRKPTHAIPDDQGNRDSAADESQVTPAKKLRDAMDRMAAMYYALANHPDHYRNQVSYHQIFDCVAVGIGAWQN
jgi:hypothetical protein